MSTPVLRVAVPSPLRSLFDYLPNAPLEAYRPGQRLLVPFGRREVVAILVEVAQSSEVTPERLKKAGRLLDPDPLLPPRLLKLLKWASDYYHHPPGEVYLSAMPVPLRQGKEPALRGETSWSLTPEGRAVDPATLRRAPKQAALLERIRTADGGVKESDLRAQFDANITPPLKRLEAQGWIIKEELPCLAAPPATAATTPPPLSEEQRQAAAAIEAAEGFAPFLLEGVTGSGKTEVYLHAIAATLARGEQALVLVPEIGLTPQLLRRFQARFPLPIALLHSGLSDTERLCAWESARRGEAPIVIGTRSALFIPLKKLGLIILDEEHDASFKQQEGFRYSARDGAVMRASIDRVPVVLGSATPSLESLHNALQGRYRHLRLTERAGAAVHPRVHLLDVRQLAMEGGVSMPLLKAMHHHLGQGGQVLLFLNRRGYAPTLLCHHCGWVSHCPRCDAHHTLYAGERRIRCHHCGADRPVPKQCPECGSVDLRPVGQGTERIEEVLRSQFPDEQVVRIDRDTTRRKGAMAALLEQARSGEGRILLGTQMLAKGHHFPEVTLVAILDADQGLFSVDFRATERMAQQIVQVAGRAGRAEKPGEVLIQTHVPDHPLLNILVRRDYAHFAEATLAERQDALLPPFSRIALLRAEATDARLPFAFLEEARRVAEQIGSEGIWLMGPVTAPMERRAGRTRAQLLLQSGERKTLHTLLTPWLAELDRLKSGKRVRWSLDVDPIELY